MIALLIKAKQAVGQAKAEGHERLDLKALHSVRTRYGLLVLARHVTDPSDYRPSVLAGLYACGADVGGVSGRSYAGGLATALVTGRLAGQAAAHGALGPLGAAVP